MDQLTPLLMPFLTPTNIATYIAVINVVAFAAFGIDKLAARRGAWRIPEARLLGFAFFGGSPGAYAGRGLFRHKTRKQPFSGALHTIATVQLIALGALAGWWFYG